jgi:hypothetical protein
MGKKHAANDYNKQRRRFEKPIYVFAEGLFLKTVGARDLNRSTRILNSGAAWTGRINR